MTENWFKFVLLFCVGLVITQAVDAANPENPEQNNSVPDSQQQGTRDNLVDSIPLDDLNEHQALQNPRIVVPENLQEMPEVETTSSSKEVSGSDQTDKDSSKAVRPKTQKELEELEAELAMESVEANKVLLDKTDKLLDLSRRPLSYVQEHVPFLTKRNIIFFGRLELDGALYSSGVLNDDDGFNMRRFRVGLAGQVVPWPGWNYKLEFDLTDGENTLSDAYLSWRFKRWGTIRIGNQKVAQTLSGQTSSLSISFMERPLPVDAFSLQRRLGFGWDTHLRKLGANITVFAGNPNKNVGSHGWAARGYFNPTRGKFHVIHIGGSFMQLSSDSDAQIRSRPESHVTNTRLVDTGVWPAIDLGSALGLELAGSRGPIVFKSEFYRTEWSRTDASSPKFRGWYAEASTFLTGEKAHYREGKFIRPNVLSDNGAWEVAFRFSTLNLNDEDIQGGSQKNLTFGVNWYSKTHWRFMANVIKVRAEDGPYGDQNPWVAQVRAQYYF